jgi:cytochrome c-type biogenesis protein CcmF
LRPTLDGVPQPVLTSEKRQHFDSRGNPTFQEATEVGIMTMGRQDVYLVLAGTIGDRAEVRINFNPLVAWVWIGGILMAVGGLIVMWPQEERQRQGGYRTELQPQHAEAASV